MSSVSKHTDDAFLPPVIRLMDPKPPGLDFYTDLEMRQNLLVEIWIRRQQFIHCRLGIPFLVGIVAFLPREEAVIGEKAASITRRQHDLVPFLLPAPVLEGGVLGVVY